ncbi:DNA mismatch endonuclease (patch repair protein) [Rhodoblastus acidophilus]|uniref:very short patch repair endonuclease n=1 Tax=Rhodoblastus acidophilus TaxID=1074 RepID=UPI00222518CA|nr:very short patch repair endonuclease [Rhodoblastus acidophilus]MCW2283798.1 DNA mismatch endonuclease (patch repair protein) [Rhodoblastus acidophilus]MCW2332853.1 DNA mismatch endonuclease (patch repair protein) [Rhodoblastus acidophilus]
MSARQAKIKKRKVREPLTRSQIMARIKSSNTAPEMKVRKLVHRLGIRFRINNNDLPGKPDLANKRKAWAIFVHGCFWHSHAGCRLASKPKTNTAYWQPKLQRNKERDAANVEALNHLGFRVLVIWECTTKDVATLTRELNTFFVLISA